MNRGDTFYWVEKNDPHLWVLATAPTSAGAIVMASCTTERPDNPSFPEVLNQGDHPDIHHATSIDFDKTFTTDQSTLVEKTREGKIKWSMPLATDAADRVTRFVCESKDMGDEISFAMYDQCPNRKCILMNKLTDRNCNNSIEILQSN